MKISNLSDFTALQIKLASPEDVKSWSNGEITKPETINYRTLKPEKDGLFCEKIFGPSRDFECYCGKYKRIRFKGIICDKCGVEVTHSHVRRERMGHLNLACPIAHVWFFKRAPSKLSLFLGISPKALTRVIYFAQYVVLAIDKPRKQKILGQLDQNLNKSQQELEDQADAQIKELQQEFAVRQEKIKQSKSKSAEARQIKFKELKLKLRQEIARFREQLSQDKDNDVKIFETIKSMVKNTAPHSLLTEDEYLKLLEYNAADHLTVDMGAEAILKLINEIDIVKTIKNLKAQLLKTSGLKLTKLNKRLRLIESMKQSEIKPEWMILQILPVIPPDLRPMVQLSGGRFATSDLNDLYRRVINRNNRLKHLVNLGAPEIILRNEKRMLQEAVDSLIDSPQSRRTTRRRTTRRQLKSLSEMLSGKQGRFRQNLLGKRVDYSGRSVIVVGPKLKINQCGLPKDMALEIFKPFVLRELITQGLAPNVKSAKNVLDRHQPEVYDILEKITVNHPVLLNRAPTLHKLGIQAFYPLLIEGGAIQLHPCVCAGFNADFDGDQMAVHLPLSESSKREAIQLMMPFNNLLKPANGMPVTIPNKEMALGCYYLTHLNQALKPYLGIFATKTEVDFALRNQIINLRQLIKFQKDGQIIETSAGRLIFNRILPKDHSFVNQDINAAKIKSIISNAIEKYPSKQVAELIDAIKELGFQAITDCGISLSVFDCQGIPQKAKIIKQANSKAESIETNYKQGLITQNERHQLTNQLWMDTTDKVADLTWNNLGPENPVKIMISSGGTRASKDQVKQLSAMRGLVVDPIGNIVPMPTKSNFREGLSVFEYVTSARGSRKGLTDSALKTADAGYLTRRLVDVAHSVIVKDKDCGSSEFVEISNSGVRQSVFTQRITGRYLATTITHPKTNKTLAKKGQLITTELAKKIIQAKLKLVKLRSPLGCQFDHGICQKCYGLDLSNQKLVKIGTPVGIIAAQSIGEPGTQLTMRIKHAGGIVGLDVTQGLPRVEELFEARVPKALSPMTKIQGKVNIRETSQGYKVIIKNKTEKEEHTIPLNSQLTVEQGQQVPQGWQLTSGSLDIGELLKLKGLRAAQEYLLDQIQAVYESQGITINDRHFEVIIRRMSDKIKVKKSGTTKLLSDEFIDSVKFKEINQNIKTPATGERIILGITRASLHSDSWLSAASFMETTNILTKASLEGEIDHLRGLKENVIIGRLIPVKGLDPLPEEISPEKDSSPPQEPASVIK